IAHGDFVMVGAYAAFWFFTLTGVSTVVALPLIALLTAAIGLLLYKLLFRNQLVGDVAAAQIEARSLLLFFGVSVVIQNTVAWFFTSSPRAYRHLDDVYHLGTVAMTGNRIATLLVAAGCVAAVAFFLRYSLFGLSIKALIQHRDAARVVGINVDFVQRVSIALGFGLAGVAGGLISMTEQISPFMGFPFTIAAFVVIIMGGLGNALGGVVAGFLLAFVEIYAVALTSANVRSILLYGVFVLVLVLRPQGILGKARQA
ncbi:MAG: branched-chain amino acid ABC transporter permease, partial [Burkholderiaceae bacterium]